MGNISKISDLKQASEAATEENPNPLSNMKAFALVKQLEQTETADLPEKNVVLTTLRKILNEDFCMAFMGSKPVLIEQYTQTEDRPFKAIKIRTEGYYDFLKSVPYKGFTNTDSGRVATRKTIDVLKEWLRWTGATRKGVVVFNPLPTASQRDYNLWRGYPAALVTTPPDLGYLQIWNEYVYNALAPDEQEAGEYIENWLAHLIQRPWEKAGVGIAAYSKKRGTGKTILADIMRHLLGSHYIRLYTSKQLTGQFSGHLADKVFANAEESCFADDRTAQNILKSLLTSETQFVENKSKDGYEVDSFLRLYVTSNDQHIVHASSDERRWLVVDNDNSRYWQNTEFFKRLAMTDQEKGTVHYDRISALYNHLLTKDIRGFNVRKVPVTAAMAVQKELSLSPLESFYRYIITGEFEADRFDYLQPSRVHHQIDDRELWILKSTFKEEFDLFQKDWPPSHRQYVAPNAVKTYLDNVCKGMYREKKATMSDKGVMNNKRYWIFQTDYKD